ncbi:MAG: 1-deoxy-D-xylulose-5-phosphate synthase [Helicobacteraceae bacterium]|jgi:transketolase|nr:1-deoxy-D-xylulose-5-phosphate synthase [Helicobacteraceae bacterium]
MRNTMINMLNKMAETDPKLVVVIDDTGFLVFEEFEQKFPDRFYNVGIAEQQFIGYVAGLALEGMNVVAYNVCNFFLRSMEQIRIDLALQNLGVTMIGVGGGMHYGSQGPTHNATEDLSMMRSLPNVRVVCPADPVEMQALFAQIMREQRLTYLRLCKNNDPVIHTKPVSITVGNSIVMRDGSDVAILATGGMTRDALKTADLLAAQGISVKVVSMHTVKPVDTQSIQECDGFTAVFTMEENTIIGGFGSSVAETMMTLGVRPKIFKMFGFPDRFPMISGSRDYLNARFGLDADSMASVIVASIKKENIRIP